MESRCTVVIHFIRCCLQPGALSVLLNLVCGHSVGLLSDKDQSMARRVPTQNVETKKTPIYFSVSRGTRTRNPHVRDIDSTGTLLRPNRRPNVL
jgi:hypothetical protein